jgi:hypothetical protein
MTIELHLRIAGALQILLALLHFDFPRRLGWRDDLERVSLLTRQVFEVHMLFVCVVLVMFGALSLFATGALLAASPLSPLVLGGIAAFWSLRLYCQWFVYDRRLWRGMPSRTVVHVFFSLLWLYLATVYAVACAAAA